MGYGDAIMAIDGNFPSRASGLPRMRPSSVGLVRGLDAARWVAAPNAFAAKAASRYKRWRKGFAVARQGRPLYGSFLANECLVARNEVAP